MVTKRVLNSGGKDWKEDGQMVQALVMRQISARDVMDNVINVLNIPMFVIYENS